MKFKLYIVEDYMYFDVVNKIQIETASTKVDYRGNVIEVYSFE